VLDLGDVGADAPESREMPSVAFFSPVMLPQMQLAQPASSPLLTAPVEEIPAAAAPKMKSGQGMLWAAIIASVGILCAGGFVLFSVLHTSEPQPTRAGASAEPTAATTSSVLSESQHRTPQRRQARRLPRETASAAAPTDPPRQLRSIPRPRPRQATTRTTRRACDCAWRYEQEDRVRLRETRHRRQRPRRPSLRSLRRQHLRNSRNDRVQRRAVRSSAASSAIRGTQRALQLVASRRWADRACESVDHFANSGRVTSANIDGPPFAGTAVGGCIASKFRGATVPPVLGQPVTVHTTVPIF